MPTVQIKNITYHPSIWPKMIGEASRDAKPGDLVQVLDKDGGAFGWGLWNPKSRMPLRIVSHSSEEIDESFFDDAIRRAASMRREMLVLDETTEAYRAIHGDADFMPGIVADKFADVLSVEITNKDITAVIDHAHGMVGAYTSGCGINRGDLAAKMVTVAGLATIAAEGELYFNLHTKSQQYFGDMRGQLWPVEK